MADIVQQSPGLSIGISTFAALRAEQKVYVDKTSFVAELAAWPAQKILLAKERKAKWWSSDVPIEKLRNRSAGRSCQPKQTGGTKTLSESLSAPHPFIIFAHAVERQRIVLGARRRDFPCGDNSADAGARNRIKAAREPV